MSQDTHESWLRGRNWEEERASTFTPRRCPEGNGSRKGRTSSATVALCTRSLPHLSAHYLRYQVLVDPLQLGAFPPVLGDDCLLVELVSKIPVLIVIHGAAEKRRGGVGEKAEPGAGAGRSPLPWGAAATTRCRRLLPTPAPCLCWGRPSSRAPPPHGSRSPRPRLTRAV